MKKSNVLNYLCLVCYFSCQSPFKKSNLDFQKCRWIESTWVSSDSVLIESWALNNNTLEGNVFNTRLGKITETLQITVHNNRVQYIATVFDQNASQPIVFDAMHISTDSLCFHNSSHDFPQTIIYKKRSNDTLQTKIYSDQNPGFTSYYTKIQER